IIEDAESAAALTVAQASERAERNKRGTEAEIKEKAAAIFDGKAAQARLESAKILLGEKRGVIDNIYGQALKKLVDLNDAETVRLAEKLLRVHAEDGDEILFAENFGCAQDVAKLSVVKEKKLKVSPKKAKIDGGFILRGKVCDKDISYGALLSADREDNQSKIASDLFL
ncbi:MAG: hypothetical protein K2N33_00200, partial [Clostridia bacterium]|nr:hypothetical protein [Clostridia bacterium]